MDFGWLCFYSNNRWFWSLGQNVLADQHISIYAHHPKGPQHPSGAHRAGAFQNDHDLGRWLRTVGRTSSLTIRQAACPSNARRLLSQGSPSPSVGHLLDGYTTCPKRPFEAKRPSSKSSWSFAKKEKTKEISHSWRTSTHCPATPTAPSPPPDLSWKATPQAPRPGNWNESGGSKASTTARSASHGSRKSQWTSLADSESTSHPCHLPIQPNVGKNHWEPQ